MGIMKRMDTRQRLESDIKDAMRAKDELRKRTLRMALSSIRLAEIEKGEALDEQATLALLHKEIKSRQESIADAERAGRPDLIEESQAEITILESYLPVQFSEQELEALARQAIDQAGAASPREMGQVMKILMPLLQGRATGNDASQVVRRLLAE
jgi:uncharacterized protein YqeY